MTIDEYRDLWIEVFERHQDGLPGWEERLIDDWRAECAVRGISKANANFLGAKFIDDAEDFSNRHGMSQN